MNARHLPDATKGTGAKEVTPDTPCSLGSGEEKERMEKSSRSMMRNAKVRNCALARTPDQVGAESMKELDEGTHLVKVPPAQNPMIAGASVAEEPFRTPRTVGVDGEGAQKPHPLIPLAAGTMKLGTGSQGEEDRIKAMMIYPDLGDVRRWTHSLSASVTSLRTRGDGCQLM